MAGDLKTPWQPGSYPWPGGVPEPVVSTVGDLSGAGVTSRGSDPNSEGDNGQGAGLKNFWDDPKQAMGENPSIAESSNSVSGLPSLPNRYEPTEAPPDPPDLTTRSPGTIDKQ
jgi:hypothetical protein